jgi:hypothetical protein
MPALEAAPFLLQTAGFSCRDAHAFNRYSSTQMTANVESSQFSSVTFGFSSAYSPTVPSFQGPPLPVLLATIDET